MARLKYGKLEQAAIKRRIQAEKYFRPLRVWIVGAADREYNIYILPVV